MRELQAALREITAASLAAGGEVPASITVEELAATGLVARNTRRWIAGSEIALTAPRPGPRGEPTFAIAHIRFGSGRTSRLFVRLRPEP